jgi:hypothetical protein
MHITKIQPNFTERPAFKASKCAHLHMGTNTETAADVNPKVTSCLEELSGVLGSGCSDLGCDTVQAPWSTATFRGKMLPPSLGSKCVG